MKRTAYLIIICALGLCATAQDTKQMPLAPIHADSIYLMDFFWDSYQQQAEKLDATPVKYNWQVKKTAASKVAKMVAQCDKAIENATILGNTKGMTDNLEQSIKLFNLSYQLSLLTGNAKYIDFAERILYNRILKQWATERGSKTWKEANDILRTIDKMAYSQSGNNIYVNTLMRCNAHLTDKDMDVYLQTVNSSPWMYNTSIKFADNMRPIDVQATDTINSYVKIIYTEKSTLEPSEATIHIRVPSWVNGKNFLPCFTAKAKRETMQILVNGIVKSPEIIDGYAVLSGTWAPDDLISIRIPTPILRVTSKEDGSQVALQRGPIVYQFEEMPAGYALNPSDPISHAFDQQLQCTTLSGNLKADASSVPFRALPSYIETPECNFFVPAK